MWFRLKCTAAANVCVYRENKYSADELKKAMKKIKEDLNPQVAAVWFKLSLKNMSELTQQRCVIACRDL